MESTPKAKRASGILLHPTSLPGYGGIGSLGQEALRFLDGLAAAGQTIWQLLPLVPVGPGASPYAGLSAFAGEPLLIDLDELVAKGWLTHGDLATDWIFTNDHVDFDTARGYKWPRLQQAWRTFSERGSKADKAALAAFEKQQAYWLKDYVLFTALKEHFDGKNWIDWPAELVARDAKALATYEKQLADQIAFHTFCQFVFDLQWQELKQAANERGIRIMGDIPIFVAFNSADVWAHREIFLVDAKGKASDVAGVPPDYFAEEGQLWGNPLYDWKALKKKNYEWWVERFRQSLALYDLVRLDHFRGFEAYWAVPAEHKTAKNGRWQPGPGADLFKAIEKALGHKLPVIAEDLGVITPEVEALRDELGFPGMRVLQFAFDAPDNDYLPHNHVASAVVYTGTHDNTTTRGWWNAASEVERRAVQLYLGRDGHDIAWDLIRTAMGSVAQLAVIPMQDVLDLDASGRMNTPGEAEGNWGWRLQPEQWTHFHRTRLRELTRLYGRLPVKEGDPPQTLA